MVESFAKAVCFWVITRCSIVGDVEKVEHSLSEFRYKTFPSIRDDRVWSAVTLATLYLLDVHWSQTSQKQLLLAHLDHVTEIDVL